MVTPVGQDTARAQEAFRALMGSHPAGVAVITTADARERPYGFTCTALCSLSLDPPRLLVCAAHTGNTLPVIAERGTFVVNLLHTAGQRAAQTFTRRDVDRFAQVPWERSGVTGLPVLHEDAHAVAECAVADLLPSGDHTIVVGDVLDARMVAPDRAPLLYGRRRYAGWPM
ncbi:flavin reductase family protein [Streptomyces sp. PTM05]|uniref:Flavin reductase family protein n=1 Tax=Streptantibioticus parmotrematis TaxID=2873249 RepID=A0ABS7QKL8_9ACTN|nr:flavin reductase family protein [Streptantibioticus parmotrematis]MBY8883731.1 flavin reductase family protein [Streptantibioticus parmotrematis]